MPRNSPTTPRPFHGYVDTTGDALRLIQAARCGLIPRTTRRLNELERRSMIRSGAIFVFSVEESGIKRWTEGLTWSPSRIAGNFLVYREVTERTSRATQRAGASDGSQRHDSQGALKPHGLIKKTITVKIGDSDHHLISYFTQEDVQSGILQRPTAHPELLALEIPPELLQSTTFRYPPRIEAGPDGRLTRIRDSDEIEHESEGLPRPPIAGDITSSGSGEESSVFPQAEFTRPESHSPDLFYNSPAGHSFHLEGPYSPSSLQQQRVSHSSVSARTAQTVDSYSRDCMTELSVQPEHPPYWHPSEYSPYQPSATNEHSVAYASAEYSRHASTVLNPLPTQEREQEQQTMVDRRSLGEPSFNIGHSPAERQAPHVWSRPYPQATLSMMSMTSDTPTAHEQEQTHSTPSTWLWDHEISVPSQYQLSSHSHSENMAYGPIPYHRPTK